MSNNPLTETSADRGIQSAFKALRDQYILDLSSVQAQLKVLNLLETAIPSRFLEIWNSFYDTTDNEAEATARFTLELQNLLQISKSSKLR